MTNNIVTTQVLGKTPPTLTLPLEGGGKGGGEQLHNVKQFTLLELRKNRTTFISLAGILPGLITISAILSVSLGYTASDFFKELFNCFMQFGVPFSILLLGSVIGSGIRKNDNCEKILPGSLLERCAGGFIAGITYSFSFVLISFLIALLLLPPEIILRRWGGSIISDFTFLAFNCAFGFGAGFVFSYLLADALLGSIAGLLITALTTLLRLVGFFPAIIMFSSPIDRHMTTVITLLSLAGIYCAAIYVIRKTEKERNLRIHEASLLIIMALAGALIGILNAARIQKVLPNKLFFNTANSFSRWSETILFPKAQKKAGDGIFMRNIQDDLFWITPDGTRKKLVEGNPLTLWNFITYLPSHIAAIRWTADGNICAILHTKEKNRREQAEILKGDPEKGLTRYAVLTNPMPYTLKYKGRELMMLTSELYAPVTKCGNEPEWKLLEKEDKYFYSEKGWFEAGIAARVTENDFSLFKKTSGGMKIWKLPGKVRGHRHYIPPASDSGIFLLPLVLGKKYFTVACYPDGTTKKVWDGFGLMKYHPEGSTSQIGYTNGVYLNVMLKNGIFLKQIDLKSISKQIPTELYRYEIVHSNRTDIWLIAEGKYMIKIDVPKNTVVAKWRLPDISNYHSPLFQAVEKGIFTYSGSDRLIFMDWEGNIKDLGKV